ncbi:hypothetical protein LCGC14_0416710 [marine sediment metagenome]|uniref:Uncharacterized protein n=1 Tax=marine sediment metagenome TaxID=412755 RepID=A0A0F9TA66_9ZZZZ
MNYPPYPVRMDPMWRTISFEQITDISSATGLTDGKYNAAGVLYAQIQVTTSDMRYRTDGTDPTSAIGPYTATNGIIEVWGQDDMAAFRAIDSAGSSKLEVTYFGP